MDRKPKNNFLPVAIAGGAMLVCCLAPVLLISGGAGLAAWFGGIDPLLAAGIAVAAGIGIVLFLRMQKSASAETQRRPSTTSLKEDR
jgi:hypothetical protein